MDNSLKPPNRLHKRIANQVDPLRIVQASQSGGRAVETVLVKNGSPWRYYKKIYNLKLGEYDPFVVAERKGGPSFDVVTVHRYSDLNQVQLDRLRLIQHPNFVYIYEVYKHQDGWYVVTEHMTRSLQEAVGNPFLDGLQLAAIIGQIVTALSYLEDGGYHFGSLTCSDVLMNPRGHVKLYGQHKCVKSDSKDSLRSLSNVMMELVEGYVREGGKIGLDNPERWGPEALSFLGMTATASSAKELLQHPFLRSWQKERLQGLISFVTTWTSQGYRYVGGEEG